MEHAPPVSMMVDAQDSHIQQSHNRLSQFTSDVLNAHNANVSQHFSTPIAQPTVEHSTYTGQHWNEVPNSNVSMPGERSVQAMEQTELQDTDGQKPVTVPRDKRGRFADMGRESRTESQKKQRAFKRNLHAIPNNLEAASKSYRDAKGKSLHYILFMLDDDGSFYHHFASEVLEPLMSQSGLVDTLKMLLPKIQKSTRGQQVLRDILTQQLSKAKPPTVTTNSQQPSSLLDGLNVEQLRVLLRILYRGAGIKKYEQPAWWDMDAPLRDPKLVPKCDLIQYCCYIIQKAKMGTMGTFSIQDLRVQVDIEAVKVVSFRTIVDYLLVGYSPQSTALVPVQIEDAGMEENMQDPSMVLQHGFLDQQLQPTGQLGMSYGHERSLVSEGLIHPEAYTQYSINDTTQVDLYASHFLVAVAAGAAEQQGQSSDIHAANQPRHDVHELTSQMDITVEQHRNAGMTSTSAQGEKVQTATEAKPDSIVLEPYEEPSTPQAESSQQAFASQAGQPSQPLQLGALPQLPPIIAPSSSGQIGQSHGASEASGKHVNTAPTGKSPISPYPLLPGSVLPNSLYMPPPLPLSRPPTQIAAVSMMQSAAQNNTGIPARPSQAPQLMNLPGLQMPCLSPPGLLSTHAAGLYGGPGSGFQPLSSLTIPEIPNLTMHSKGIPGQYSAHLVPGTEAGLYSASALGFHAALAQSYPQSRLPSSLGLSSSVIPGISGLPLPGVLPQLPGHLSSSASHTSFGVCTTSPPNESALAVAAVLAPSDSGQMAPAEPLPTTHERMPPEQEPVPSGSGVASGALAEQPCSTLPATSGMSVDGTHTNFGGLPTLPSLQAWTTESGQVPEYTGTVPYPIHESHALSGFSNGPQQPGPGQSSAMQYSFQESRALSELLEKTALPGLAHLSTGQYPPEAHMPPQLAKGHETHHVAGSVQLPKSIAEVHNTSGVNAGGDKEMS